MSRSMLFVIAVLIVALGARPVLAGDSREYVGETAATTSPSVGIMAMHVLCDADFPGARMCSSSDIIRNGGLGAPLPASAAYVNPSLFGNPGGQIADVSGLQIGGAPGFLSCIAWTVTTMGFKALVIDSTGKYFEDDCSMERTIACCAERKGKK